MIAIPIASLHPVTGVGSILGTLNALSVNPISGAVHGERLTRLQIVNPRATRIVVLRIHVSVAIVQVHDAAAVNRALAVVCGRSQIAGHGTVVAARSGLGWSVGTIVGTGSRIVSVRSVGRLRIGRRHYALLTFLSDTGLTCVHIVGHLVNQLVQFGHVHAHGFHVRGLHQILGLLQQVRQFIAIVFIVHVAVG